MGELRERVARICHKNYALGIHAMDGATLAWDKMPDDEREVFYEDADDILALLEPAEPVAWRIDQRPSWDDEEGLAWETLTYCEWLEGAQNEVRYRTENDYGPEYRIVPLYTRGTDDE